MRPTNQLTNHACVHGMYPYTSACYTGACICSHIAFVPLRLQMGCFAWHLPYWLMLFWCEPLFLVVFQRVYVSKAWTHVVNVKRPSCMYKLVSMPYRSLFHACYCCFVSFPALSFHGLLLKDGDPVRGTECRYGFRVLEKRKYIRIVTSRFWDFEEANIRIGTWGFRDFEKKIRIGT